MTLAELISEVYTITGRPDRIAETSSAVKSAILKLHQSDFYYKDLFESGLAFSTADYVQNLDYRLLIPRFRSVKYFRKYDYINNSPGSFLTKIEPEQILDRYASQKSDIFYVAGAYIQINSSTQEQYYLFGCYLNPDISGTSTSSWIALDHPYAIIYDAAAKIEVTLGKLDEAKIHQALAQDELLKIQISNIQPIGY